MENAESTEEQDRPRARMGLIGLGNAGRPMGRVLLRAGYRLTVYDLRSEAVEVLAGLGATPASGPRAVAEASDVVITSLPAPRVSEEVVLGPGGVMEGLGEGGILVEASTVLPSLVHRFEEAARRKGAWVVDAGISRIQRGEASHAVSTMMVGGEKSVVDSLWPVLTTLGQKVFYTGPAGTAMIVKIVNNAISHVNMLGICEAMALGAKAGADPKVMAEVIGQSGGGSRNLTDRFEGRVLKGDFEPGMPTDMVLKDSQLALEMGRELGVPMILNALKHNLFQWASARGLGGKDYSSAIQLWEELAGVTIRA